ncbi:MAG: YcaO-like family protein [Streptosporangiaceae bacterium]
MDMVYCTGTRRCRTPARTLELIGPLLARFGITRLADITGLDVLGVPVAQAVRPLAATMAVSQGKGATVAAAMAGAAMEAIELHHAEDAVPPPALSAPAADLGLGYEVTGLDMGPGSLVTGHTVLDWVQARGAVTGAAVMVPRDLVWLGQRAAADWRLPMLSGTSNGLAAGNTRAEAVAHACYELMERDDGAALAAVPAAQRRYLDLDTVPAGWCADLVARIRAAGAWLEVTAGPSRFGLPFFVAYVWASDCAAGLAAGAGTHGDPEVALSRAITEAAQSRLTVIAGARDDIAGHLYPPPAPAGGPPAGAGPRPESWAALTGGLGWCSATDEEDAARAAGRILLVAGAEPMIVDLAGRPELAVVKALCPGLAFSRRHIPRRAAVAA